MQAGVVGNHRHQPHRDVGAGDLEPVGDRRACRRRRPATSSSRLQAQQLADLTAVVAAQGRAQSLEAAQRAAAQEQGREQLRRFLTPGAGYQPGNAQMFQQ